MIDVVVATAEEKGGAPGPGGAWRGGRAGGKGSRRWKGGADARQGNGCVGVLRDKKGGGGDPAVATGVNKRGRQGYGRCPRIGGPHRPLRRRCAPPSPTGRPTLAGDDDCNGCRPPLPRPPPPRCSRPLARAPVAAVDAHLAWRCASAPPTPRTPLCPPPNPQMRVALCPGAALHTPAGTRFLARGGRRAYPRHPPTARGHTACQAVRTERAGGAPARPRGRSINPSHMRPPTPRARRRAQGGGHHNASLSWGVCPRRGRAGALDTAASVRAATRHTRARYDARIGSGSIHQSPPPPTHRLRRVELAAAVCQVDPSKCAGDLHALHPTRMVACDPLGREE